MVSQIENSFSNSSPSNQKLSMEDQLLQFIHSIISPIGYEVIHLEIQNNRQKSLRIFIDFNELKQNQFIGIEDCAQVSRALNEALDEVNTLNTLFKDSYELEVSSPGLDRPLRNLKDFQRFQGKKARIHLYRPLELEEIQHAEFFAQHSKQKVYVGTLKESSPSSDGEKILLSVPLNIGKPFKGKKNKKVQLNGLDTPTHEFNQGDRKLNIANSSHEIALSIPLQLIAKANLEPNFDFEDSHESELRT